MLCRVPTAPMRCLVSLSLTFLLAVTPEMAAAQPEQTPMKLNIVIVEGDGAINNIRQRTAREPIVQVEDENHRPVAGASVLFLLPDKGPSGVFANGSRTLQVTTDKLGRAAAKGLRVNEIQGKFQIQVEASYQGVSASTSITQVNAMITAAAAGGISGKLIAILAIAGGGAATGIYLATRSKGSTPTPTTITPGAPNVGGPPQ
jgi:hypothetical protein